MLKPRRQPGFKRDFRLAHVLKGTLVTDANQTTDEQFVIPIDPLRHRPSTGRIALLGDSSSRLATSFLNPIHVPDYGLHFRQDSETCGRIDPFLHCQIWSQSFHLFA